MRMLELNGTLKDRQQAAFRRLLLLNPAHIVAVYAPFAARNLRCHILTVAGVLYEVEEGYDEVKRRLSALTAPQEEK